MNIKVVNFSEGTTKAELMVVFRDLHHLCGAAGHRHLDTLAFGTKLLRKNHISPGKCKPGNEKRDFLDLVNATGHVTMQDNGVADVNANAKGQGLSSPAIDYWSYRGHYFVMPAPGTCSCVH